MSVDTVARAKNTLLAGGQGGETLQKLRRHIARVAPFRAPARGLPSGHLELDRITGGWPRPGLSSVEGAPGSGRLEVLLPLLRWLTARGDRVPVVDSAGWLYPPGLRGVVMNQVLWVRPGASRAAWAAGHLARCGAFPLVVLLDPLRMGRGGRRLQLASEEGGTVIVRLSDSTDRSYPATLQLVMEGNAGQRTVRVVRGPRGRAGQTIQLCPGASIHSNSAIGAGISHNSTPSTDFGVPRRSETASSCFRTLSGSTTNSG